MDNFNEILNTLDANNQSRQDYKAQTAKELQHLKEFVDLKNSIKAVSTTISSAIDKKSNVVKVDNFPKSFSTPDIEGVVKEVQALRKQLDEESRADDITDAKEQATLDKQVELLVKLEAAIKELPKQMEYPEAPEEVIVPTNQDYIAKIEALITAVKNIKTEFKPNISVKPADVKTDLTKLEKKFDILTAAVKAISIVVPEQDDTQMLEEIKNVYKAINSLVFPVPNYVLPYKDSTDKAVQVVVNSDGSLPVSNISKTARYDYSSSTIIYVGEANLGSATSSPVWTITKFDLTSSSAASGKVKLNGTWDNRASESYQ